MELQELPEPQAQAEQVEPPVPQEQAVLLVHQE